MRKRKGFVVLQPADGLCNPDSSCRFKFTKQCVFNSGIVLQDIAVGTIHLISCDG